MGDIENTDDDNNNDEWIMNHDHNMTHTVPHTNRNVDTLTDCKKWKGKQTLQETNHLAIENNQPSPLNLFNKDFFIPQQLTDILSDPNNWIPMPSRDNDDNSTIQTMIKWIRLFSYSLHIPFTSIW
ncbi:hypothetical protein RCL_jg17649.t1 [Rhizophagus clarus]|uniref:Uncharacterized protein n=1 Tax=Rhizophagus clarus TaxID=94130 RepID=A0A8H3L7Y9_9GLOM|nr:hypothetical protein RCL_jg17649.t1 [Rhizophagus clarus]